MILKKSNLKEYSSSPNDKGILGSKPLDSSSSVKGVKINVKSQNKDLDQNVKKVFIYRKCYNCGDTFHMAKDCPQERIERKILKNSSSISNPKGPISKWVPKN